MTTNLRITDWLIGSDPEIMLKYITGRLMGAFETGITGTKWAPQDIGEGCGVQVDNVMIEFTVPPSDTPEGLHKSIQYCLNKIQHPLYMAVKGSSANYPTELLKHPIAQEFGCEPDYCVWTLSQNPKPNPKNKRLRTAGGHVHISYTKPKDAISIELIKALDLFLGVPSVIMDNDTQRRLMYGKAGAFRIKDYGIEYRTLSNFWVWDLTTIQWIYKGVKAAIDFVNSGQRLSKEEGLMIQKCINKSDKELVQKLTEIYSNTALHELCAA